jgi:hypothetical protein
MFSPSKILALLVTKKKIRFGFWDLKKSIFNLFLLKIIQKHLMNFNKLNFNLKIPFNHSKKKPNLIKTFPSFNLNYDGKNIFFELYLHDEFIDSSIFFMARM